MRLSNGSPFQRINIRGTLVSDKLSALLLRGSGMNRDDLLEVKIATDWDITILDTKTELDAVRAAAKRVDAIVGSGIPGGIPRGARLKLYQAPFTGYDWIKAPDLPKGAVFCNTHEHETTIAEHLLAGMLEFQTGLMRETHPLMRAKSYSGRNINRGPHHLELRGTTVGIIGYGQIGREVARRCKAFDMKVMAVSRVIRDEPDLVDWYGTVDQTDRLLAESDFVICCLPGGTETRGMINAQSFATMKSDAVIANVGRGEVIDEAALFDALSSRRIRGGIIDVWYTYPTDDNPNPWPSKFPFQKLDNIIMSPHNSAWTAEMSDRRWTFVAKNLDRLARGEALLNVCFEGER
jgi:phosphoglycerate dehydrogenase-like enzyme